MGGEAALNATKAYNHIVAWNDAFGGFACVLIGKCADVFVGIKRLNGISHLIYKPNHQARVAAVLLLDGATLLALTG